MRRKKKIVTLKDILRAKRMLDKQPVPKWDRIYWGVK